MNRRPILLVVFTLAASLLLLPSVAFGKRPTVAARSAATLRATASETGSSVATVKKGDMLTVLGASGDWSNVQTADGKKGFVKTSVVSEKKATTLGTEGTQLASAENTTEGAIRGKGIKRKTVFMSWNKSTPATISKELGGLPQVAILAALSAADLPATFDAAKKIADDKKADLVVCVSPEYGEHNLRIFDVKAGKELPPTTLDVTDQHLGANLAKAVSDTLIAANIAAATPASSPASPTGGEACVKDCIDKSQMKAMSMDAIKADCEKTCAGAK